MSEVSKEQIFNELYDQYLDEMVGLSMHVCDSNFRPGGVEEKRKQVARNMVELFHLRLIESSVKITTVGGGLFSHYPQGRAKQTEGSESSGEQAAPPASGEKYLSTSVEDITRPAPPAIKESLTVEPEVDNSGHPQAKERDRLDKFLITMMCHVKEVYEANGTPWGEDDEERFVAIRSLILEMHNNISCVSVQKPASDALRGWRAVLVERGLWHEWDEECFKNIINAEEK